MHNQFTQDQWEKMSQAASTPPPPPPSPRTLNLGDVLRNAISSPAITLTISWWSEAEALWDIDSPHPETVSIIG